MIEHEKIFIQIHVQSVPFMSIINYTPYIECFECWYLIFIKHIMCMGGENKGIVRKYEDKGVEYKDAHGH